MVIPDDYLSSPRKTVTILHHCYDINCSYSFDTMAAFVQLLFTFALYLNFGWATPGVLALRIPFVPISSLTKTTVEG